MTSVLLTLGLNITSLFYICAGQIKTNRWLISVWIFVGIYNKFRCCLFDFYCCYYWITCFFPDFKFDMTIHHLRKSKLVIIFRNKSQFCINQYLFINDKKFLVNSIDYLFLQKKIVISAKESAKLKESYPQTSESFFTLFSIIHQPIELIYQNF